MTNCSHREASGCLEISKMPQRTPQRSQDETSQRCAPSSLKMQTMNDSLCSVWCYCLTYDKARGTLSLSRYATQLMCTSMTSIRFPTPLDNLHAQSVAALLFANVSHLGTLTGQLAQDGVGRRMLAADGGEGDWRASSRPLEGSALIVERSSLVFSAVRTRFALPSRQEAAGRATM